MMCLPLWKIAWVQTLTSLTQDKVALQGNLDPSVLFAGEDVVRQEARKVIEDFGHVGNGGHVFNLGHGIDKP